MIRRTTSLMGPILVAALAAPMAPSGTPLSAQDIPAFTGSWTLDQDNSDDPREVMRQSRRGSGSDFTERGRRRGGRGRGGGGRGGGGGGGGGRGGGGGGEGVPSENQMAVNRVMMGIGMWRAPTLEISETELGFVITLPDGSVQVIQTDKTERIIDRDGIEIKTKAQAKENEFKIEYKAPGNAKVERKFQLKDEGDTLEVQTSITNTRMGINFRYKQVYHRGG